MPIYPFKCANCGTLFDIEISVEDYEEIVQEEKGVKFTNQMVCEVCGDNVMERIYTSFSVRGGTDHTKYMRRAEEQVLIQAEKGAAFKKDGFRGLRDHRYRRREKTHDKTGRKTKPWHRRMRGDS